MVCSSGVCSGDIEPLVNGMCRFLDEWSGEGVVETAVGMGMGCGRWGVVEGSGR